MSAFEAGSWVLEFDDNETCIVDSEDLQEVYSWCIGVLAVLAMRGGALLSHDFVLNCHRGPHRGRAGDRPSPPLCTTRMEWSCTHIKPAERLAQQIKKLQAQRKRKVAEITESVKIQPAAAHCSPPGALGEAKCQPNPKCTRGPPHGGHYSSKPAVASSDLQPKLMQPKAKPISRPAAKKDPTAFVGCKVIYDWGPGVGDCEGSVEVFAL